MTVQDVDFSKRVHTNFGVFHELMTRRIQEILLVSSSYDAFILEEDGSLASRIIHEYSGLNLSRPPRVTRTSSAHEALLLLSEKTFDMVLVTPHLNDLDVYTLVDRIKTIKSTIPVYLLAYRSDNTSTKPLDSPPEAINRTYIWSGNSDLLLAIIKNTEDQLNVDFDTGKAQVRIILLVEDSPVFYSTLLPFLYTEVVRQTQAVLETGLNEEHRLLTMRARPKILLAQNYEEAETLYKKYEPYLLNVISDTRLPRQKKMEDDAGIRLLSWIKKQSPAIPLLLMSAESKNRELADTIPATFIDKTSPRFYSTIHDFLLNYLGFGDFVFRLPGGTEVDRAGSFRELEDKLPHIPDESLWYHARRNHFSTWLMARSEITLASIFRDISADEFSDADELRNYIITQIHALRKWRQKGVITQFNRQHYDVDVMDFVKIGDGSLGGKARGLAFMANLLLNNPELLDKYESMDIEIPSSVVICSNVFESFIADNGLAIQEDSDVADVDVIETFLQADLPDRVTDELRAYLDQARFPLAIRSSSLLQDAHYQPSIGLYCTIMLPNNHDSLSVRLRQLQQTIKMIYASTFFRRSRKFAKNVSRKISEESMAIMIQRLAGNRYGNYFYPAVSGSARSLNFYPVASMNPEEGIVNISMGFGRPEYQRKEHVRFSPKYPSVIPDFTTVDDILRNAQRSFYALNLSRDPDDIAYENANLEKRSIQDAQGELPVQIFAGTYIPEENILRDTGYINGPKVMIFSPLLKDQSIRLPELLCDLLDLGCSAIGCPVEIEFALTINPDNHDRSTFHLLQIRPMVADEDTFGLQITPVEIERAVGFSTQTLGNGINRDLADIVYVKPQSFSTAKTVVMAEEIGRINAMLVKEKRQYLLVGPGRWGSADRWLGIPVRWNNISGVGAIIELRNDLIKVDASRGYHFFQRITSMGVPYITITEGTKEFLKWEWIESLTPVNETAHVKHVRTEHPMVVKIDGRTSQGIITLA